MFVACQLVKIIIVGRRADRETAYAGAQKLIFKNINECHQICRDVISGTASATIFCTGSPEACSRVKNDEGYGRSSISIRE